MTQIVIDSSLSTPSRIALYIKDGGSESTTMFATGNDVLQAEDLIRVAYAVDAAEIVMSATCVTRRLAEYIRSVEGPTGVQLVLV